MTAITINAKNRTIELTKTFATASSKYGTDEYNELQAVRKDYPNYKVVTIARKAPKTDKPTFKGLTYEYMEKYIMAHDDENQSIMNEYLALRGESDEADESGADQEQGMGRGVQATVAGVRMLLLFLCQTDAQCGSRGHQRNCGTGDADLYVGMKGEN